MLSEDEQRELRAWRSRQVLFMFALFVLVLPLFAFLVLSAIRGGDGESRQALWLSVLAFGGVALFLAPAPLRWWTAGRDLADNRVQETRGYADIRMRGGFGLIHLPSETLHLGGERFPLLPFWREQLTPGLAYTVRYAPRSRAILSVSHLRSATAKAPVEPLPDHLQDLSDRDCQLIRLLSAGLTDKDIARDLNLSPTTVRTYNSDLYLKLGIKRRGQVRPMALRYGLLDDIA